MTTNELTNLYAALSLEIAAVERYADHQDMTSDPTILALLQGLMRNEDGHEEELIHQIERLDGDADEAGKVAGPALAGMVFEGDQVKGQKTNLAMLRADLAFEAEATKTYAEFAAASTDDEVKGLFVELSKAERGHVNGLRTLIQSIEQGKHPIAFFCPTCGWSVDFGAGDEQVTETRCRMCGVVFQLSEVEGDYVVSRK